MHFHSIHPSLSTWMPALETRLADLFQGEFAVLRDACSTVVGSRGKRLRPVMLLLSCSAFGEVGARAISSGCIVELVHTASLVHDDVVDEADSRRGEPSARAQWGNKFSILLGDFILGRVFELATEDGDNNVLRLLASTATEMGRGVILELTGLHIEASEETYWKVVHGKTASLFGTATELGALLGGASPEMRQALNRYGECFGYAFQLADDLMDLQGTEDATGKPLQIDWQQRRATLPLLYALRHVSPATAELIRKLWQEDPFSAEHFFALRHEVEAAGGFEYGWEKVKEYLGEAAKCLHGVPPGPSRDALASLCANGFPLPILPATTASR